MQTFKPLTKLLVILALCPPFAAAEGLWNGLKAGAGNAYERGRSLSLDVLATGADVAAKGIDRTPRVTDSGMRAGATLPDPVRTD